MGEVKLARVFRLYTQSKVQLHKCTHCNKSWTRANKLKNHECLETLSASTPKSSIPVKERVARHRHLKGIKDDVLRRSPKSRTVLIKTMIWSPTQRTRQILVDEKLMETTEIQKEQMLNSAVVSDLQDIMSSTKGRKSTNTIRLRQCISAGAIGPKVKATRKKKAVAKTLFSSRTARKVEKTQLQKQIIEGDSAAFMDVNRKCRGEKLSDETKSAICNYWKNVASHPTTDTKRNLVRKKLGKNEYLQHNRHIMERTYREEFSEFRRVNPDIAISETTFCRCKPFYVKPPTSRDLEQCSGQRCVNVRKAFRALMNFRQQHKSGEIYPDLYSFVNASLCPKGTNKYHDMQCIKQECDKCGIKQLSFSDTECSMETTHLVTWYKFDYVMRTNHYGKEAKHLELVPMHTPPKDLVDHLKAQLVGYPLHTFTAMWQRKQWGSLIENLPKDHVAVEMDFSENYTCMVNEEAQSLHWGHNQVISIHVYYGDRLYTPMTPATAMSKNIGRSFLTIYYMTTTSYTTIFHKLLFFN